MKSSVKHQREKNSLELFLLDLARGYKENKEKYLQALLIFLIVFAAILFIRFFVLGKGKTSQNNLDDAYYLATSQSILSFGAAPETAPFEELAKKYASGDTGALVRISIGEAKLKAGEYQIMQRKMNSRSEYNNPELAALDPGASFDAAAAAFDEVASKNMAKDAGLNARALFGAASAQESKAELAADDAQVAAQLDQAKALYTKLTEQFAGTPYAVLAQERLAVLAKSQTALFFNQLADQYRNMPVPPEKPADESILPEGANDTLDPSSDAGMEILNELPKTDDVAPAEGEAAPAENAPAETTPADAAPADAAAPAENAENNG